MRISRTKGNVELQLRNKGYLTICKEFVFHSAHRLPNHEGCCKNVHGHSYKLQVVVRGPQFAFARDDSPEYGMLLDFSRLKGIVQKEVIDRLDHSYLNDIDGLFNPTAEIMVCWILDALVESLKKECPYVLIHRIRLYETDTSYAEWVRE